MNAGGRNTDINTSVMPMIGPNNSRIASMLRLLWRLPALDVLRHALHHHDRVVHHDPDREHDGEQRQQVDAETPSPPSPRTRR